MKYYGNLTTLELNNFKNFPNKFPIFNIITDKERLSFNALMVAAAQRGFNMNKRKICFTVSCEEGFTHEYIYNMLKELPEISEEKYMLLKDIPHWNPIEQSFNILKSFIELHEKATDTLSQDEDLNEIIQIAFDTSSDNNNIEIIK